MQKIVISTDYSFTISADVIRRYFELCGHPQPYFYTNGHMTDDGTDDWYYIIVENPTLLFDDWAYLSKNFLGDTLDVDAGRILFDDSNYYDPCEIDRTDENFISAVEELSPTELKVVEIPDGIDWYIESACDGCRGETIHEKHMSWH
jgi:hypothetical protein